MLKAAGLIMIIAAGIGLGFGKSCELAGHLASLQMLRKLVVLLEGEIRCTGASLPDAFLAAGNKLPAPYRDFMAAVAGEAKRNRGKPFGELFRACGETYLDGLGLPKNQREIFFSLGEHLGYLDLEMQTRQLRACEEELERLIGELREELPGKKKMYQSLGILGGILLAVLVW